jgi:hypothetical protein
MDFLREAIQAQLAGQPFAWDMIEDIIVKEKALHKMRFIWDYVWCKTPYKKHNYYYWFHLDQSYYLKNVRHEIIDAIIDMPIPALFQHSHFVSSMSNMFMSKEDAYYGLIWNWYNWNY